MLNCILALYQSLMTHVTALKSLQRQYQKHLEREQSLGDILDSLRTGYNPNYQDMAVLEAVRGWEHLAGLPHINDVGKDDENAEEEGSDEETSQEEEEEDDGLWSELQVEHQVDELLRTDYDALLIEHDKHIGAPASPSSIRKCCGVQSSHSLAYSLPSLQPLCISSGRACPAV